MHSLVLLSFGFWAGFVFAFGVDWTSEDRKINRFRRQDEYSRHISKARVGDIRVGCENLVVVEPMLFFGDCLDSTTAASFIQSFFGYFKTNTTNKFDLMNERQEIHLVSSSVPRIWLYLSVSPFKVHLEGQHSLSSSTWNAVSRELFIGSWGQS